jgi:outer membrane protein TolC
VLLTAPPPWPAVPPADATRLLAVDPEVQRRLAAHEVARGDLARAHAGKYPRLLVNPSVAFNPAYFFGAVSLELPIGAEAEVCAAVARVDSARLAVRAAVLEALEKAEAAAEESRAADELERAARAQFDASARLADAERARVETQGEGFTEAVLSANMVVQATRGLREAAVAAARARVRAALAAGWPSGLPSTPGTGR